MKTYTVLLAEDVPHYAAVSIEADNPVDAVIKAEAYDLADTPTNPDWHNAVARRIVEVTDEDENIVAEFVSVDRALRFNRNS